MKRIYVLIFSLLGVLLMAYPAGAIIGGRPMAEAIPTRRRYSSMDACCAPAC